MATTTAAKKAVSRLSDRSALLRADTRVMQAIELLDDALTLMDGCAERDTPAETLELIEADRLARHIYARLPVLRLKVQAAAAKAEGGDECTSITLPRVPGGDAVTAHEPLEAYVARWGDDAPGDDAEPIEVACDWCGATWITPYGAVAHLAESDEETLCSGCIEDERKQIAGVA